MNFDVFQIQGMIIRSRLVPSRRDSLLCTYSIGIYTGDVHFWDLAVTQKRVLPGNSTPLERI